MARSQRMRQGLRSWKVGPRAGIAECVAWAWSPGQVLAWQAGVGLAGTATSFAGADAGACRSDPLPLAQRWERGPTSTTIKRPGPCITRTQTTPPCGGLSPGAGALPARSLSG